MAEEISKVRDQAQASAHSKESDLDNLRAKLQAEHESATTELKKLHEQSLKESLQKVYKEHDVMLVSIRQENEQL